TGIPERTAGVPRRTRRRGNRWLLPVTRLLLRVLRARCDDAVRLTSAQGRVRTSGSSGRGRGRASWGPRVPLPANRAPALAMTVAAAERRHASAAVDSQLETRKAVSPSLAGTCVAAIIDTSVVSGPARQLLHLARALREHDVRIHVILF